MLFCAHSIPASLAATCAYAEQLRAASALVMAGAAPEAGGASPAWELVWQSRSGPPQVPWLEPDVGDRLVELAGQGVREAVLVPIGFVSDHLEVVYDLDTVAVPLAAEHGISAVRVPTVGTDERFVRMIVELVDERRDDRPADARRALSGLGVWPDVCAAGCCPAPVRPGGRPVSGR